MARLLLIEDNAAARDIFELYFSRHGHEVLALADARTVCQSVSEFQPQLLLLDLDLGGVSGIDICRQIRALPAPHGEVPVVILSALDSHSVATLELVVDGYIPKTDALAEILRQVNAFLAPAAGARKAMAAAPAALGTDWIQLPVLDHCTLDVLRQDLDDTVLGEIIAVLIEDMETRAGLMNNALQERDSHQLAAQVHALKSSAATYGASQLNILCNSVASAYRLNHDQDVCAYASCMMPILGHTIQALRSYAADACGS